MEEENRLGLEEVLALLRDRGISFEEMHHVSVYTIDEMLALDMPDPEHIAKNLFLRDDKKRNYYLIVSREDRKVDLKALREVLGSRPLSMASENDLWEFLKLRKGAVTPFGVLNDPQRRVDVVIDSFFEGSSLGIHPNDNTCTVWLGSEDLVSLIGDRCRSLEFKELP